MDALEVGVLGVVVVEGGAGVLGLAFGLFGACLFVLITCKKREINKKREMGQLNKYTHFVISETIKKITNCEYTM